MLARIAYSEEQKDPFIFPALSQSQKVLSSSLRLSFSSLVEGKIIPFTI